LGWLGRFSDEEVAARMDCPVKVVVKKNSNYTFASAVTF
jgi:hypothetical protein